MQELAISLFVKYLPKSLYYLAMLGLRRAQFVKGKMTSGF